MKILDSIFDFFKARSGVYADNAKNRRLHRVGQHYGSSKKEEPSVDKKPIKEDEQDSPIAQATPERVLEAVKQVREAINNGKIKLSEEEIQKLDAREKEAKAKLSQSDDKGDNKSPQADNASEQEGATEPTEEIASRIKFDDLPNSGKVKLNKYLSGKIKTRVDESFKNIKNFDDETLRDFHDSMVSNFNENFDDMRKSERAENLYKIMKIKAEMDKRAKEAEKKAQEPVKENSNVDTKKAEEIQSNIYDSQDEPVEGQADNTSETDPGNYSGNEWFDGDVATMDREELAKRSIKHIQNFLKVNNLPVPEFVMHEYENAKNKFQQTGHYSRAEGRVYINPAKTRKPVMNPGGMQWSYPGYKVDKTPMGVLAHEVGHHIDHVMKLDGMPVKGEKITGYEPTYHESVAESLRLFILNPDLLKKIAPQRYQFFIDKGLKPTVTKKWNEVLHDAPEAYAQQIDKNFGSNVSDSVEAPNSEEKGDGEKVGGGGEKEEFLVHPKFGRGKVIGRDESKGTITIDFGGEIGEKKLMEKFSNLKNDDGSDYSENFKPKENKKRKTFTEKPKGEGMSLASYKDTIGAINHKFRDHTSATLAMDIINKIPSDAPNNIKEIADAATAIFVGDRKRKQSFLTSKQINELSEYLYNSGKLKKSVDSLIQKARSGVYKDNAENRRKHRVGQHYGNTPNVTNKESGGENKDDAIEQRKARIAKVYSKLQEEYGIPKRVLQDRVYQVLTNAQGKSAAVDFIKRELSEKNANALLQILEDLADRIWITRDNPEEFDFTVERETPHEQDDDEKVVEPQTTDSGKLVFDDIPNSRKVNIKKYLSVKMKARADEMFEQYKNHPGFTLQQLHDKLVKEFNAGFDEMSKSVRASQLYLIAKVKNELEVQAKNPKKKLDPIQVNNNELIKTLGADITLDGSFTDADGGKGNPNYDGNDNEYSINCQSCCPAFELRTRGFDVEALGWDEKNEFQKSLARDPTLCFKNVDGTAVRMEHYLYGYEDIYPSWRKVDHYRNTAKMRMRVANKIQAIFNGKLDGRYFMEFCWKRPNGKKGAHIITVLVKDGKAIPYDPQNGKIHSQGVSDYLQSNYIDVKWTVGILRVDDKLFKPDVIKYIIKKKD